MQRNEWGFEYTAGKLAEAATNKLAFHNERLGFWKAKKDEVWSTIQREGLEVDEKISMSYRSPKASDFDRGARVLVRNDLQADLDEVLEKLKHHTSMRAQYEGWQQALEANAEARFKLDIEDWQFFFAPT
jgi:hypothetical protein